MGDIAIGALVYTRRGVTDSSSINDGSIEVLSGGGFSVDVYISNLPTAPSGNRAAIIAAMTKVSTISAVGLTAFTTPSTWLYFDITSGSPTIQTCNLIRV